MDLNALARILGLPDRLPLQEMYSSNGITMLNTPNCPMCDRRSQIKVPEAAWKRYLDGAFVQDAFPMLTADEREMLLNGTHPDCFDSLRSDDDDD